jgi:hypothetical protein
MASCAIPLGQKTVGWTYKKPDLTEYAPTKNSDSNKYVQIAIKNFNSDPPYPRNEDHRLILVKSLSNYNSSNMLMIFSITGVSDSHAVYIINMDGKITDRFLESGWE